MLVAERHFKNECAVKDMISKGHKRGVCDGSGRSVKVVDGVGCKVTIARPITTPSSAKTYVYRDGKMVLKDVAHG